MTSAAPTVVEGDPPSREVGTAADVYAASITERYTAVDDDEIRAAAACAW